MSKVRDLPENTSLDDNDLLYAVDASEGPNGGRKITKANLKDTLGVVDDDPQYVRVDGTRPLTAQWDVGAQNITNIAELYATVGMFFQGEQVSTRAARVINVKLNPTSGEFSSVKAALDSITDSGPGNPVLINVGPGVYNEDPMTMKPFVIIRGQKDSTLLVPNDNSSDFITGVEASIISELTIQGPTDTGKSMVVMAGGLGNGRFILKDCILGVTDRYATIDSTGGVAILEFENCQTDFTADITKGFVVEGTGIGVLGILSFIAIYRSGAVDIDTMFEVRGAGNILLTSATAIITQAATINKGFFLEDGATCLSIGPSFLGNVGTVLDCPNVGAGPTVAITAFGSVGTTKDIDIANPNTDGFITGAFSREKIEIDPASTVSLFGAETTGTDPGTTTIGDIFQGATQPELLNLSKFTRTGGVVGLISGGELSIVSGLTIGYNGGTGFIQDSSGVVQEVTWEADQLLLPANASNFIVVDAAGVVSSKLTEPDLTKDIVLGRIVTNATTGEVIVEELASMVSQPNEVEDFLRDILGSIYSTGSIVTENGGTPFALNISGGKYAFGTKKFTPSGFTNGSWTATFRDASPDGYDTVPSQSLVDNVNYDNNSGSLVAIPAGKFVKHAYFVSGDGSNEEYFLVYGQTVFDTQTEAEQGDIPTPPSFMTGAITLIASIIVQEGQASITQIRDERPRIGFTASGVSAASTHGNLLGLLADDHPQYFRTDGTRIMGGNIDMGTNNIVNVGTVDGVVVSAHADRHRPLGIDPLATASAVALGANSTNTEGTGNSFARNDHTHDINTGTASTITPDQSNSEGVSDDLARADHIHNIPASAPVTQIPDQANDEGTAPTFARSDHVHEIAADAPTTNLDGGTSNAEGSGTSFSRSDHTHAINTGIPVTQGPDNANAEGTSNNLARADHIHNIPAAAPITQGPDNANNEGSSLSFARADHIHNIPAGPPATNLDGGTSNTEGAEASFARADHIHALNMAPVGDITEVNAGDTADPGTSNNIARGDHQHSVATGTPSTLTPEQGNSEGTSTNLARADHVHDIPAGTPVTQIPDSANAEGNSASFARANHVHNIPAATAIELTDSTNSEGAAASFARSNHTHAHGDRGGGSLHAAATTSVSGFMSSADKTKLDLLFLGEDFYQADQLENPINADWAVNSLAPASVDTNNNGLTVRRFDDTTEEGVGLSAYIPVGATNLTIRILHRAQTAPGVASTVGLSLYERGVIVGVDAWSTANTLDDVSIGTNTNFTEFSQTLTLATLGLTAGQVHQFELTRVAPQAGTNLVGDWNLHSIRLEWS